MTLSNAQAALAEDIKAAVASSDAAHVESIEKAIQAGHLLLDVKSKCKHGEWLPFLDRAGVPERKAQRLMKLARSGLKSDTVSDLGGFKAALKFINLRESAERQFNEALEATLAGNDCLVELKAALLLGDDMIEMFPEEKRGPMRRHRPEYDALRIVQRIAEAKTPSEPA